MDHILSATDIDQSARTSSNRSARSDRIEIVTRSERRRWSLEQKREIVAESLGPELTPTEVARKYAISSGQLLRWCRLVGQFRGSDKLFPVDLHAALRASAAGAGAGACPGTSAGSGRA